MAFLPSFGPFVASLEPIWSHPPSFRAARSSAYTVPGPTAPFLLTLARVFAFLAHSNSFWDAQGVKMAQNGFKTGYERVWVPKWSRVTFRKRHFDLFRTHFGVHAQPRTTQNKAK